MGIFVGEVTRVPTGRRVELGVEQVQVQSGREALAVATRENDEPVFLTAGAQANGEFRCSRCGYGVVVRNLLPTCPMCQGDVWEEPAGSPWTS